MQEHLRLHFDTQDASDEQVGLAGWLRLAGWIAWCGPAWPRLLAGALWRPARAPADGAEAAARPPRPGPGAVHARCVRTAAQRCPAPGAALPPASHLQRDVPHPSPRQVLSIFPTTIRRRILRYLYLRHLRACYLFRKCPQVGAAAVPPSSGGRPSGGRGACVGAAALRRPPETASYSCLAAPTPCCFLACLSAAAARSASSTPCWRRRGWRCLCQVSTPRCGLQPCAAWGLGRARMPAGRPAGRPLAARPHRLVRTAPARSAWARAYTQAWTSCPAGTRYPSCSCCCPVPRRSSLQIRPPRRAMPPQWRPRATAAQRRRTRRPRQPRRGRAARRAATRGCGARRWAPRIAAGRRRRACRGLGRRRQRLQQMCGWIPAAPFPWTSPGCGAQCRQERGAGRAGQRSWRARRRELGPRPAQLAQPSAAQRAGQRRAVPQLPAPRAPCQSALLAAPQEGSVLGAAAFSSPSTPVLLWLELARRRAACWARPPSSPRCLNWRRSAR